MSLDLPPCPSLLLRKKGKKQMNVVSPPYFAQSDFAAMLALHVIYPCPKWRADFLIRGFCFVISALGSVTLRWQNLIIVFLFAF